MAQWESAIEHGNSIEPRRKISFKHPRLRWKDIVEIDVESLSLNGG